MAKVRAASAVAAPQKSERESEPPETRKLTFKERRELETLELGIAEAEKRKAEIEEQLVLYASNSDRVHSLFIEQQQLLERLDRDLERWAELAERANL
jgi:ATP-binding cassette subfamily F protein uup